jgi:tetratricopeptide (TPR) repeat protein
MKHRLTLVALMVYLFGFSVASAQPPSFQIYFAPYLPRLLPELSLLFELQNRLSQHNLSVEFLPLAANTRDFDPNTLPQNALGIIDFSQGGIRITPYMAQIRALSPILYVTENRLNIQLGGLPDEKFNDLSTALFQAAAGDCTGALPVFDAINPDQNWQDLNMVRGNCQLLEGDYRAAIKYYDRACDDAGGHYCLAPTINAAWAYLQLGQTQAAFDLMGRMIDDYTFLYGSHVYNDASYAYNEYNLEPIHALTKRSQLYALAFRYDEAIADMDAAIALNPDSASLYVERGQRIMLTYEWDRALADYNHALALDPAYADAYYYRGILYASVPEGIESRRLALADFQSYLELDPKGAHTADAARSIAELQALLDALE